MSALRSNRAEVRNPLLSLPSATAIRSLDASTKSALRELFIDMRNDARLRAAECWARHKAPMACYWKAVGVYCNHIARVLA